MAWHYVLHGKYLESSLLSNIQTFLGIFTSYSDIFSHIEAYLDPCAILAHLESFHIQNPPYLKTKIYLELDIFGQGIFWNI